MKRLVFSMTTMLVLFCISVMAQDNTARNLPISTPGYYYFEPDNVSQHSQNAAITLTFDMLPTRFSYKEGLQVVFKTETINGNNGDINIQINTLGTRNLLAQDGQDFGIGELDMGLMITATYDGTSFISNHRRPREFRFIEVDKLTLTGNAYSVADTSIPPVATAPILIGIKAEATNTGDVTLSVNGSQAYPVYLSDGAQIPSGSLLNGTTIFCTFTNIGGVGFRAINLHPARSLKGMLLATLPLPAGTHVDGTYFPWQVESGITIVGTADLAANTFINFQGHGNIATTDALLTLTLTRVGRPTQLGWYIEIINGSTIVHGGSYSFGEPPLTQSSTTTTDGLTLSLAAFGSNVFGTAVTVPTFAVTTPYGQALIVDAADDYKVRVYISDN